MSPTPDGMNAQSRWPCNGHPHLQSLLHLQTKAAVEVKAWMSNLTAHTKPWFDWCLASNLWCDCGVGLDFNGSFGVSLNKMLTKQLCRQWFVASWQSRDFTLVVWSIFLLGSDILLQTPGSRRLPSRHKELAFWWRWAMPSHRQWKCHQHTGKRIMHDRQWWSDAIHDDVIKWRHFPRYWPIARGIHRSLVNSPHKGQWRGA